LPHVLEHPAAVADVCSGLLAQAENGEAAAVDGSDSSTAAVAKKPERGFMRSESFKAAFGPTMVILIARLHYATAHMPDLQARSP
jgi:hypothetical protein